MKDERTQEQPIPQKINRLDPDSTTRRIPNLFFFKIKRKSRASELQDSEVEIDLGGGGGGRRRRTEEEERESGTI